MGNQCHTAVVYSCRKAVAKRTRRVLGCRRWRQLAGLGLKGGVALARLHRRPWHGAEAGKDLFAIGRLNALCPGNQAADMVVEA